MPPPRRAVQEDSNSRSDDSIPPKQKNAPLGAGKRKGNGHISHTNNLREIASSNSAFAVGMTNGVGDGRVEGGSLFDWSTSSPALLHSYTFHHRLPLPAPFHNPTAPMVLSPHSGFGRAAGIGKYSPTMARPRAKRRIPKEELSKMVRKHFNGMSVSEGDVVVDLMYRIKYQDKALSAKLAPSRRNLVDSGGGGQQVAEPSRVPNGRAEYTKNQQQK